MSVKTRELSVFLGKLEALKADVPSIMDELAVGEGNYAVKQARLICKTDSPDIVNTGQYRMNWKSDEKALRSGKKYRINFFNNLDYAKHLEYGFRSHFVPGHWAGNTFVYVKGAKEGMFVGPKGGYVRGHFTMRRAVKRTLDTQAARLKRKMDRIINDRMGK